MNVKILLFSCIAVFAFVACNRKDFNPDASGQPEVLSESGSRKNCELSSFVFSSSLQNQTIIEKVFDPSSQRVSRIQAGVFSGGAIVPAWFNIHRTNKKIAFLRDGSSADTVLVVTLNNNGKPLLAVQGNSPDFQFLPTFFEYKNNRLSAINILLNGELKKSKFIYQGDNLVAVHDVNALGIITARTEYKYHPAVKAKQPFYMDEPRRFSWNTFSLLQYMGLLAETHGENLRIQTTVEWENNYMAYNRGIANPLLDGNGKLVSYDVTDGGTVIGRYKLTWNCSNRNNDDDNDDDDDDGDD